MTSDFSRGVMISLNEHMAQTLLDGMAATIRKEKLDMSMQIQGLEMLVENLESLNARVISFMGELRSNKENTFTYDELDLEGLEWFEDRVDNGRHISRIPSPITYNPVPRKKFTSGRLAPLTEEVLTPRPSFETIVSDSSTSLKSKSTASMDSITIKVELPNTPPLSGIDTVSTPATVKSEFRQIDPKKIPKRKPVPSQLQIPPKSNNKAFRRKEVPNRMYANSTADASSTSVNTTTTSIIETSGSFFNQSRESIWTPPITDEEYSPSPIRKMRREASVRGHHTATSITTTIYQPKPRRVKSKQLKISIPHRKSSGGKSSGKSSGGKPLRTPSSASLGSAKFQKRAIEELDRAIVAMRLSYTDESEAGSANTNTNDNSNNNHNNHKKAMMMKRMDSGREKKKMSSGSIKRKLSLRRRNNNRRKYELNGIPRCDSPVLGSFDVVFAVPPVRR
ncbi:hypothetical protein ABW20_dc0104991 [Dactylellina cionopaga]|nr:hypothetical protein ABW20_dc0104991 [Dactylellina cionopaga]